MFFRAFGHRNVKATHEKTIEFIKDKGLGLRGDCIIGVGSDFSLEKIREFIKGRKRLRIVLGVNDLKEEINGIINHKFNDDREIVLRKSGFVSERTLLIKCDKACSDLKRDFVEKLKAGKELVVLLQG